MSRKTQRVERLEKIGRRLRDPALMTNDELMVAIFGSDTPELHAAQAMEARDAAAFDRMLLDMVEQEEERVGTRGDLRGATPRDEARGAR